MNEKSLKNLRVPTSMQARLNGSKGGKASAKSKKKAKTIKEVLEIALSSKIIKENDIEHLKYYYPDVPDEDLTTLFLGTAYIVADFTDICTSTKDRIKIYDLISNIMNEKK